MSFNWEEEADKGGFAEAMPNGRHEVRIEDVFYEDKEGPLTSKDGHPQIRVLVRDQQAREGMIYLTLSPSAGWALAKMLKAARPKVSLADLTKQGVEPRRFAIPEVGDKHLIGKQLLVDVSRDMFNGKEQVRVQPFVDDGYKPEKFLRPPEERRRAKKQSGQQGSHRAVVEEDIPF